MFWLILWLIAGWGFGAVIHTILLVNLRTFILSQSNNLIQIGELDKVYTKLGHPISGDNSHRFLSKKESMSYVVNSCFLRTLFSPLILPIIAVAYIHNFVIEKLMDEGGFVPTKKHFDEMEAKIAELEAKLAEQE